MAGIAIHDGATYALISNAAQERLKYILEQVRLIAQHRIDISMKVGVLYDDLMINIYEKLFFRMIHHINK